MTMHYLSEHNILIFLIQVSLLWIFARGMGEVFRRWKQPTITAEILAGVLLGPTIFGRTLPDLYQWVFPQDAVQQSMLETVAWFGIFFFLLQTGLEMDFSSAWRQRRQAITISLSDVVIPMIVAFIPTLFLSDAYMGNPDQRILFAVFIATISTISALPVTARILQDLNFYKTDVGFLIMGALSLNDIIGWAIFTLVLGVATQASFQIGTVLFILAATVIFAGVCLVFGGKFTNFVIGKIQEKRLPEPGSSLTFICLLGSICGAITLVIGIHALFGFFIAGIIAGEARSLPEKTRNVISQMVHAIFIPLFFANIGLKINFLHNLDWFLIIFVSAIGIGGRYLGAWLGVTFTDHPRVNRHLIAIAHTPGGEMQIIVGMLALEYGLVTGPVFVAIVFSAVVSSILIGPWMYVALKTRSEVNVLDFFSKETIVSDLRSSDRGGVIRELSEMIGRLEKLPDTEEIFTAVMSRESSVGTAIEEGIAIPHARIKHLDRSVIAVGRSSAGVDWNSPDGKPTQLVFLILSPEDNDWVQLQVLRFIAKVMQNPQARRCLLQQTTLNAIWDCLRGTFGSLYIKKQQG